jgi:hypothetical protein
MFSKTASPTCTVLLIAAVFAASCGGSSTAPSSTAPSNTSLSSGLPLRSGTFQMSVLGGCSGTEEVLIRTTATLALESDGWHAHPATGGSFNLRIVEGVVTAGAPPDAKGVGGSGTGVVIATTPDSSFDRVSLGGATPMSLSGWLASDGIFLFGALRGDLTFGDRAGRSVLCSSSGAQLTLSRLSP